MNSQERSKVRGDLEKMENVQQMFDYLSKNFHLNEKLGNITKSTFIMGIDKALVMVNPNKK